MIIGQRSGAANRIPSTHVRFDDPLFSLAFWSALLALYYLILSISGYGPRLARFAAAASAGLLLLASFVFLARTGFVRLLLGSTAVTFAAGHIIARARGPRGSPRLAQATLAAAIAVNVAVLAIVRRSIEGPAFVAIGVAVIASHAVAFVVDAFRGDARVGRPVRALLYLLHFPVLPGGPILRYGDFESQEPDRVAGLGAFTYGMRRVIIGVVKIFIVARSLGRPADAIFALAPVRLTADVAWLGAVLVSLQLYFLWSGYADVGIGVGRMLGYRHPENFRRPYTAQSVRDFWRQWNITAMTWLRDYLYLPIAGRDAPTPRLFVNIIFGFAMVGLWHGAGPNVLIWAVYSGAWLSLEAIGVGRVLDRVPAPLRHVYLLLVVIVGWVILRAGTAGAAVTFLQGMAGWHGASGVVARRLLTPYLWTILVVAVVGAGPLVPAISRWRVTLDAATAAVLMMISATTLFVWRAVELVNEALKPLRQRR
jgi:alginate O-acetyltransferase complex protein AlgI